jgi:hypothetical protein
VSSRRQAAAGLLLLPALGLPLLGCDRSPEAVERARVLAAIDALRDAPGADTRRRRALLEAVEREPASAPAAVAARDACAATYRHLLDGEDLAVEMRRAIERGEGARPELPGQLHEVEAHATEARRLMPGCESALAALRHPGAARPLP